MNPRSSRILIATGLGMVVWSALTLVAMHGGLALAAVTR